MTAIIGTVACGPFGGFETSVRGGGGAPAAAEGTRESTAEAAVLPTERCGDFFIALVHLNGQGPFRMLLDTGYPRTQLAPHTARALGARWSIGSVRAGRLEAKGRIPIGIRDLDVIGYAVGAPIDGILGYPVFDDLLQTYDFVRGEVRVREGALTAHAPGVVTMSTGDRPFVHAHIGADTFDVLIDTGYNGVVALLDLGGRPLQDDSARAVGARVRTDGVSVRRAARIDGDLVAGALRLRDPIAGDAVARSLLGQEAMRGLVVTLDRVGGLAQFVTPEGDVPPPVPAPPSLRGTGIVAAPGRDHLEVLLVVPGSGGEAAGMRAGDRIVAVDGVPIGSEGCTARREERGESNELTVEREGTTSVVRVALTVLVS